LLSLVAIPRSSEVEYSLNATDVRIHNPAIRRRAETESERFINCCELVGDGVRGRVLEGNDVRSICGTDDSDCMATVDDENSSETAVRRAVSRSKLVRS
jgi:hypothetical protein